MSFDHGGMCCRSSTYALPAIAYGNTIANVVGTVKKGSSSWIKEQQRERKDPALLKFHWQNGYAAFSVSESKVAAVKRYIQDQEEHHKRVSFQDEYRTFLKKHNVSYDEQYVWD